jgi:hypothetical protein
MLKWSIISLTVFFLICIVACEKENIDSQNCNNIQQYDPDFDVFPISDVKWIVYSEHQFISTNTKIDTFRIGTPVEIFTKSLPLHSLSIDEASGVESRLYYPLISNVFITDTAGFHPFYNDTVTYFRLDTLNNVIYEVFTENFELYDGPIMDYNSNNGDTISWYYPAGNSYNKFIILDIDSLPMGTRHLKRINFRNYFFNDYYTILQGAELYFPYGFWYSPYGIKKTKFYYKTDSLTILSQ